MRFRREEPDLEREHQVLDELLELEVIGEADHGRLTTMLVYSEGEEDLVAVWFAELLHVLAQSPVLTPHVWRRLEADFVRQVAPLLDRRLELELRAFLGEH